MANRSASLRALLLLANALVISASALVAKPPSAWAAKPPSGLGEAAKPRPLFFKGPEKFRVVDERGGTPIFRLLEGTSRKRAMAFAINAALRARPSGDKARASSNYVEASIEEIVLRADRDDPDQLRMQLRVNGELFPVRDPIDRQAFLEGRKIGLRVRPQTEEAPPLSVETSGHLAMRWNATEGAIEIARAEANFVLSAPLSEDVVEVVEFRGRAIREL